MRERWTDHGLRSLAALFVVVMAAMVPAGAGQSQDKKPIVIAVPVGLSGVNSVVAPAAVQSGEPAVEGINAKGGVPGRKPRLVPPHAESGPAGAPEGFNTADPPPTA